MNKWKLIALLERELAVAHQVCNYKNNAQKYAISNEMASIVIYPSQRSLHKPSYEICMVRLVYIKVTWNALL